LLAVLVVVRVGAGDAVVDGVGKGIGGVDENSGILVSVYVPVGIWGIGGASPP